MKHIAACALLFVCCLLTINGYAQKVDNKKGVTYIDEKPFLKIDGGSLVMDNSPTRILSYQSDKLLFVITKHYYNYNGANHWYNEVRFADFDMSFKSSYDYKPLIKSLYENGVLTPNGEINQEATEKYIRLFGYTPPERSSW